MRSWDSVKVTNEALQAHGRAGVVVEAEPSTRKGEKAPHIDVRLDGDTDPTRFAESDLIVL